MRSIRRFFEALILLAVIYGGIFTYHHVVDAFGEPALSPGAIRPKDAAAHVGESVEVEGIAHVHVKQSATFIDMGGDYLDQDLAVVIWPDDRRQFGNLAALDGKSVAILGTVAQHDGRAEIVARSKRQIRAL